jgi:hypothetical protein
MSARSEIVATVVANLRERSAASRQHYLTYVREGALRAGEGTSLKRVGLLAHTAEREADERELALLREACAAAGAQAEIVVRVPAQCQGFASSEEGARERRDSATLATTLGLSKGRHDLLLASSLGGDGAAGVLVGCLRFGHFPLLLVPGAASSEVVTRAAFETQVLLAALRLDGDQSPPAEPAQRLPFLRQTIASALDAPPAPLAELVNEEIVVQGIMALLAISAGRPRLRALVAMARAAGIRIQRSDIAELAATVPSEQNFGGSLDGPTRPLAVVRTLRARGVLDQSG